MITCRTQNNDLVIEFNGVVLIVHNQNQPFVSLYRGQEDIDMYRGNFFIKDKLTDCCCLNKYEIVKTIKEKTDVYSIRFYSENISIKVYFTENQDRLVICTDPFPEGYNRIELKFFAESQEHIYGCGEQFSFFDLRGRHYPLWTQEQGVGRNKQELLTRLMDEKDRSGGDYHTTFYPQPTYVTSRGYYLHAQTYGYADFDFSAETFHNLIFWKIPQNITIGVKPSFLELVQDISLLLGRQRELPSWIYDGIILGIQGGTAVCLKKLETMQKAGCPVTALWVQDWEGQKITSFGKRLKWNWLYDNARYPNLPETIKMLKKKNVRFLGYINPYVLENETLYQEAADNNFLALNEKGTPYLVDFGEFNAGIVDFTNPHACNWYISIIGKNLIGIGISGWMADFGEYLPVDVFLNSGMDPMEAHNAWPGYWAQINKTAVIETKSDDECFFFMRAGNMHSLQFCSMMWAGDQNVDWSEDDGIASALTAALSLAMCGMGIHHSDIGGYTTVRPYLKRSKELLLRWTEFSAFTVLMRTHEGNIPEDNWQFDSDEQTIQLFTRMASIHKMLKPYLQHAVYMNHTQGIPIMLPVFLMYPVEPFFTCKNEYLLGQDMLVAPILHSNEKGRRVMFPDDIWISLFTGKEYVEGTYYIEAPLGFPPVFFKRNSRFSDLFKEIHDSYGIDRSSKHIL